MVSLIKSSQICRVVEIFISDVESESITTSVKLLALICLRGNRQTQVDGDMWVGSLAGGSMGNLTTCFSILCVVPCTVE